MINFQVGVFVSRTWRKKHGLLVGLTVAAFHLVFLLYLHFAYHSVYDGRAAFETLTVKQYSDVTFHLLTFYLIVGISCAFPFIARHSCSI